MKLIDLTAYQCPYPLVQIKLALKKLKLGESLSFSISDSGSRRDVPQFLKKMGYQLKITDESPHCLSFMVTKGNNLTE
ncbi:sulfurtransferase TusA family protein [Shewanella sp. UCD-KL21]|uniref:sulfurtransferase TusA family protein n=1 Tax=Shewanella sp. UCD-KL21 TaxID=1917164 RepID=UPI000970DEBB|nr:sulfurtransferase TusA family protein [Shewanella sp. UCD-KL21]